MFKKLMNEILIQFDLKTESPLLVRSSSESSELEPNSARVQYLKTYRVDKESNFKLNPILPGSSIKGVFRSNSERLLGNCCDIVGSKKTNKCLSKVKLEEEKNKKEKNGKQLTGTDIYLMNCAACRLFGNLNLKSRISFKDAYPKEGHEPIMNIRNNVAIDRFTGAAKDAALFDSEVVEDGVFTCEIKLENAAKWHVKLILGIIENINNGFITFGGGSTKGFGKMKVEKFSFLLRRYKNLEREESKFDLDNLKNVLEDINIQDEILKEDESAKEKSEKKEAINFL
ncbi:MAG: CRISPR-associated RAMP protein [Clostridiaceae bacterium]|nr:CRISPR-associated RAMP protein [Clostridiaceae bacterium]